MKEKLIAFKDEVAATSIHRTSLIKDQKKLQDEYNELRTQYNELIQLGEEEKAKELEPSLSDLRAKLIKIQGDLEARSQEGDIREIIKKHPEIALHQKALALRDEGIQRMAEIEQEGIRLKGEIDILKKQYLSGVHRVADLYRKLGDTYGTVLGFEKYLPDDEHKVVCPQKAPAWIDFDIETEISRAFGKPFSYVFIK